MKTSSIARQPSLRFLLGSTLAASALIAAGNVSASPVITGFQLLDPSGGTLDNAAINNIQNTIELTKTFDSVNPLAIRLTVGHGTGSGGPFAVSESINNVTGLDWTDYHIKIDNAPDGAVFSNFEGSTMGGFTLDAAPDSGTRNLNFTGVLASNSTGTANFLLSLNDPGKGKTYTLDLVQTPTTAPVPVPMAGYLFGSGLLGLAGAARRRTKLA